MDIAQRRAARRCGVVSAARATARVAVAFSLLWTSYLASGIPGISQSSASRRDTAGDSSRAGIAAVRSRIVSDTFWSQALGIRKVYVAYLPPSYDTSPGRRYPVAYYLHGMWGNEWDWLRAGHLDRALDSLIALGGPDMIVVMPDGDDSWYTTWNSLGNNADCRRAAPPGRRGESVDAYCVPWPHYDDYLARDLVSRVDSTYRTIATRGARAVAGLSMGGYGAVSLALAYPDVFAAAASHSGILSPLYVGPRPFSPPPRYAASESELRATAGRLWPSMMLAFGRDTTGWWPRDPGRRASTFASGHREPMPALMLDVGVDDPYADQSRDFHHTLQRLGVRHEYAERPGRHDWAYWSARLGVSLAWIGKTIGSRESGRDARLPARASRSRVPRLDSRLPTSE